MITERITYACSTCGATDCKLWREYQSFLPVLLFCAPCASKNQDRSIDGLNTDGKYVREIVKDRHGQDVEITSDQIGWLVPAVPTPEWDTFWGYTSVRPEGVAWWRYLPSYPNGDG